MIYSFLKSQNTLKCNKVKLIIVISFQIISNQNPTKLSSKLNEVYVLDIEQKLKKQVEESTKIKKVKRSKIKSQSPLTSRPTPQFVEMNKHIDSRIVWSPPELIKLKDHNMINTNL